jgi:hypothetical protein
MKTIIVKKDENIGWYETISGTEIPYFYLVGGSLVAASCTGVPIGDDEDLEQLAIDHDIELPEGFFWTADGDHYLCLATDNYEIEE